MDKCRNNQITFKPYEQNQIFLIDFDSMIPKDHVVREVNDAINNMNIDELLSKYTPGGTSIYHPKMMLKVIIFAYTQGILSSRKIEKALNRDIYFMWLAGMNHPDFRTINIFRSERMKDVIEKVLSNVTLMLAQKGYINLDDYFVDGTKIEANANKYTFVWKGSTKKYKEALDKKVKELMKQIELLNSQEDKKYTELIQSEKQVTSEEIEEISETLEKQLETDPNNKEIKKAKKIVDNDYLPRMKKYEKQLETMGENRNSYSRTDNDATFMRMKEDHMKNGQLKPGYNVQIGTQNQFVLNTLILQDRNDNAALVPMLENLKKLTGKYPKNVCADSGYGNEETYTFLRKAKLKNYVKFTYFHQEQKKKYKENKFLTGNLKYEKETDEYICPKGRKLKFVYNSKTKTSTGYIQKYRNYECEDCKDCEFKDKCTKSKGNRKINVNVRLNRLKDIVRKNLTSKRGLQMRSKRPIEVEATFGNIKWNMGFKRFLLRGLEKVNIEWSLLCIAHNFNKISNMKSKGIKPLYSSKFLQIIYIFLYKLQNTLQFV